MKLNPSKCVFEVTAGKFLGFMVSQRGYRGQPGEATGHNGASATEDGERSTKLEWQDSGPKQIRLQSDGKMSTILLHSEKIVRMDERLPESI